MTARCSGRAEPATTVWPAGLRICWIPMPEAPARNCTIKDPNHKGDHYHEYSGDSWPRRPGGKQ